MARFKITWPVRPFSINQKFGENTPCVKDFGLPTQSIVNGTQKTCPVGYVKLYQQFNMVGHNGTDLMCGRQPVYAACSGTVIEQQTVPARGLGLGILTDEKVELDCGTYYAKLRYWHLESFKVKVGDKVTQGQQIGISDNTGYSSGNHLHFELQPMEKDKGGHPKLVNPPGSIEGAVAVESYFMTPKEAQEAQLSVLQQLILALKLKLGIKDGGTGISSYTNEMNTNMFKISLGDIFRAIVIAIVTGAVLATIGTVSAHGFDVFTADWLTIGRDFVNGGFSGFVGYIVKNMLTDSQGKFLKVI